MAQCFGISRCFVAGPRSRQCRQKATVRRCQGFVAMLVQAEGWQKCALLVTAAKGIDSEKVLRTCKVENKLKLPFSFFLKKFFSRFVSVMSALCECFLESFVVTRLFLYLQGAVSQITGFRVVPCVPPLASVTSWRGLC